MAIPIGTVNEETIIEFLSTMTDIEREFFFEKIRERYCIWCGAEEVPGARPCQCRNDE
jgi:hypothetical protein